jgi:hypothetical protein
MGWKKLVRRSSESIFSNHPARPKAASRLIGRTSGKALTEGSSEPGLNRALVSSNSRAVSRLDRPSKRLYDPSPSRRTTMHRSSLSI